MIPAQTPAAQTPAERLAQSRERLRHALNGTAAPDDHPEVARLAAQAGAPWWGKLAALPGADIVIDATQRWWARHPLRVHTLMAIDVARGVVHPLAQRHPLALVAGAFLIGGLLGRRRRPLGWILKPALFAGLVPQLLIASLAAQAQAQRRPLPTPPSD